jgi:hypothetical protein
MLSPNHLAHDLATRTHHEKISHAARIQMIQRDRRDGDRSVDRSTFRRLTATRLAAALTAVVFSIAVAAGAVAAAAASGPAGGGGTMLLY